MKGAEGLYYEPFSIIDNLHHGLESVKKIVTDLIDRPQEGSFVSPGDMETYTQFNKDATSLKICERELFIWKFRQNKPNINFEYDNDYLYEFNRRGQIEAIYHINTQHPHIWSQLTSENECFQDEILYRKWKYFFQHHQRLDQRNKENIEVEFTSGSATFSILKNGDEYDICWYMIWWSVLSKQYIEKNKYFILGYYYTHRHDFSKITFIDQQKQQIDILESELQQESRWYLNISKKYITGVSFEQRVASLKSMIQNTQNYKKYVLRYKKIQAQLKEVYSNRTQMFSWMQQFVWNAWEHHIGNKKTDEISQSNQQAEKIKTAWRYVLNLVHTYFDKISWLSQYTGIEMRKIRKSKNTDTFTA